MVFFNRFHLAILFLGLLFSFGTNWAVAQSSAGNITEKILTQTLYAKTDAETDFCKQAIKKRDQGVIPNQIFYAAYRYSVSKPKDRRFIYFQTSLERLCADSGIRTGFSTQELSGYSTFSSPMISKPVAANRQVNVTTETPQLTSFAVTTPTTGFSSPATKTKPTNSTKSYLNFFK